MLSLQLKVFDLKMLILNHKYVFNLETMFRCFALYLTIYSHFGHAAPVDSNSNGQDSQQTSSSFDQAEINHKPLYTNLDNYLQLRKRLLCALNQINCISTVVPLISETENTSKAAVKVRQVDANEDEDYTDLEIYTEKNDKHPCLSGAPATNCENAKDEGEDLNGESNNGYKNPGR